jgi:phage shock protein PspC (stress-responsive transcriptional regulator)
MNCKLHPEREAIAGCISCGGFVCDECDVPVAGKHHCKLCLARATAARGGPTVIERASTVRRASPRLSRSRTDAILGGVCGGLAQYLGMDAWGMRVLVAASLLTGVSVVLYFLAWVIIPLNRSEEVFRA